MKTNTLALAVVFGLGLMGGLVPSAMAQDDPRDQRIPNIELESADVRDALKILFKSVGVSYTIDGTVMGLVTVSLKDQPFETVLQAILKQVNATYRVEGGIYRVIPREDPVIETLPGDDTTVPEQKKTVRRLRIRSADPYFIFMMLQGTTDTTIQPEMSSLMKGGGGYGGGNNNYGGGNNNYGGGYGGNNNYGGGNSGFGGGFGGGNSGFGGGGNFGGGFGGGNRGGGGFGGGSFGGGRGF